jgi:hypothetical protein
LAAQSEAEDHLEENRQEGVLDQDFRSSTVSSLIFCFAYVFEPAAVHHLTPGELCGEQIHYCDWQTHSFEAAHQN